MNPEVDFVNETYFDDRISDSLDRVAIRSTIIITVKLGWDVGQGDLLTTNRIDILVLLFCNNINQKHDIVSPSCLIEF